MIKSPGNAIEDLQIRWRSLAQGHVTTDQASRESYLRIRATGRARVRYKAQSEITTTVYLHICILSFTQGIKRKLPGGYYK